MRSNKRPKHVQHLTSGLPGHLSHRANLELKPLPTPPPPPPPVVQWVATCVSAIIRIIMQPEPFVHRVATIIFHQLRVARLVAHISQSKRRVCAQALAAR